jgi:hypothetical protein
MKKLFNFNKTNLSKNYTYDKNLLKKISNKK